MEGWIEIPQRGGRIILGRGVHIARNVEFSVPKGGSLTIGDRAFVGRGVVISAHKSVVIGADSLLGEYVCIHDNNHVTKEPNRPIAAQGFESGELVVGVNSWIGSNVTLVMGSSIGDNCIVGAGAVVTKVFPNGSRIGGVPARPL